MKDTFSRCHPIINFLYFGFVFAFSAMIMHPFGLVVSLTCSTAYSIYLNGKKTVKFSLAGMLPMMIISALLNPAFNHEGATILTYLYSGNPLTLESIIYGIASSAMLVSVITWFSCYSAVMTSDKFVYIFGRIIPALSLVLSMTLRFVPKFKTQIKIVSNAQKCVGRDLSRGSVFLRMKSAIKILSIMIAWSLENAIETADSMKSRGYGLPGRSAFSIYRFDTRDKRTLAIIGILGVMIIVGMVMGGAGYRYYPTVMYEIRSPITWAIFLCYLALCISPIIMNESENRKWHAIKLKT